MCAMVGKAQVCVRECQAVGAGEKGRWTVRGSLRGRRGAVGMVWHCFRDMNTWATSDGVCNAGGGGCVAGGS